MFIDHKNSHAAASASFCVRFSMGSLLVCGLLGTAQAGPGDQSDQRAPQRQESRSQPAREAPREAAHDHPQPAAARAPEPQRASDPRSFDNRSEEQRRAIQEASRNAEMSRRAGRLTPDERRDLRRQINEVGQDIYAAPPRR
jgi:hypothetical protein